ncbi:MAG: DNA mismatch repair protein MutS [Candidatus Hodarchaeales archaeon]|jgi:DNA mismatch repair protein MutS
MSLFPEKQDKIKFILDLRSKVTPVMQQWFFLKKKYPEAIHFFRMGDFYELFYEDAQKIAPILDLKLTTRGTDPKGKPIPLAGIPVKALNAYLPRMIEKKIPVAVVEQIGEPIKIKNREFFPRDVVRVITPGTVLTPELLSSRSNNYLLSIHFSKEKKSKHLFAWAVVDVSTGEFKIAEYESMDLLLNEVYRLQPAEVLLSPVVIDNHKFIKEIDKMFPRIHKTYGEKYDYDLEDSIHILTSFFKTNSLDGFGISDNHVGICAAGALLTSLERRKVPFNSLKIQYHQSANYLIIDSIARKNLEMETNLRDNTIIGTLLEIIDQTATPMGGRLLRKWFRQPLINKTKIDKRLDIVSIFLSELNLRQDLIDHLKKITDIERIVTKIYYKGATPRDLIRLKDSLDNLVILKHILDEFESLKGELSTISSKIHPLPEVVGLINQAIIEEPPTTMKDGGVIKNGYNTELDNLRGIRKNSKQWLRSFEAEQQKRVNDLARKNRKKDTKIKVSYTRGHGYYIEVRSNNPIPEDYTIVRSLKDRTRYATPELLQTANKILTAEEDIIQLEQKLYKDLLNKLESHVPPILNICDAIAKLDVQINLAHVANAYGYTRPEIIEEPQIHIKGGRHPVVERLLPLGEFVPNDSLMNNADHQLLIISGANMGGKSTYLRQVALIVILAQMGSFVPAESAKIGIVDRIFTRVGIVDDIWKGQSHFMVEMNETSNILNNATDRSLILLDEIGRGTSTNTGLAIAWAVVKYLYKNVGAKTLFATHFHQLNEMENAYPGIKNYHVTVKQEGEELIFLRKLRKGGTDESFGIEVAQLAGFPSQLIQDARYTRDLIDKGQFFSETATNQSMKYPDQSTQIKDTEDFTKATPTKTTKAVSLAKFFEDEEWKEVQKILRDLDINNLTPIQALNMLQELRELVEKRK